MTKAEKALDGDVREWMADFAHHVEMARVMAKRPWVDFRCYYCGRFLGMTTPIHWQPEPVSVTERIDPPDDVPVCAQCWSKP